MVESLKGLNRICQKPHYREVGNWMVRHVLRDAALPLTWLLLHTNVTANQVTAVSLLIGLVGILLFSFPPALFFLTGALLLQFWYLLDHVDGQIARYRGTSSLTGRFFDFLTHHLIHGVIFFSLGFYCFQLTERIFFLIWGFLASFSIIIFNLTQDTKYKTFFERLSTMQSYQIMKKDVAQENSLGQEKAGFSRKGFSFLHKTCEIHVLMNILTVAAVLQVFSKGSVDLRFCLFVYYGVTAPLITMVKICYWIRKQRIDQEFQIYFRELKRAGG